jgi:hypothetical protein
MSIVAHENGQRTDYKKGRSYLNVRGLEMSVPSLQARQQRFDFWQGLFAVCVSDEVIRFVLYHNQAPRY